MKRVLWLSSIATLAISAPAFAADNVTVKDAAGATVTTASRDVAGVQFRKDICVTLADTTIDCFSELNAALLPEDSASANADTGLPVFAVRKATPANTSGADGDYEALQINGGRLWTDAGALLPSSLGAKVGTGSLSVVPASDGFSVNASQTGTWNITNISGTVSLPTGAATAAKQPALGTAGTPSSDVITVQGVSGGTNLNVSCQSGCSGGTPYTEDAAAPSDPQGIAIISRRRDTMTTAEVSADGDNIGLISTNKGELRINDNSLNTVVGTTADAASQSGASTLMAYTRSIRDDIRSLATDTNPLTVKTDQTTHGTTDLVAADITKIAGTTVATGNGVTGTGSIRVTVASDNSAIPGNVSQIGGNTISTGNGASGTGVQRVTIANDSTGQVALAAGTATIGATYGFAGTVTTSFNRPADTTAYTANDIISDSTSAPTTGGFTFSNMCRASGGSGIITDAYILSNDTAALSGKLLVYDSSVTAANDNGAEAISDTDAAKLVAEIPFTLAARASNASVNVQNLNIGYTCVGSANLRFLVMATGGTLTTVSANTYTFRLKYVQTN